MGKYFGTDGVRGVAGADLTCEMAMLIGRGAAAVLTSSTGHKPRILIGKDTRQSGDMLEAALTAGLCSVGADVESLGVVPTPAVAYLVRKYNADAGVVISASHNPMEFNGIKIFAGTGYKLPDEVENEIEAYIDNQCAGLKLATGDDVGRVTCRTDGIKDYTDHLYESINGDLSGLNVCIDCANGASAAAARQLFPRLGAKCTFIGVEPDGKNINAGVGSTHLDNLEKAVVEGGFDCGIAFDGDADRCLACDEKGQEIDGDKIIALLAMNMKEKGCLDGNTAVVTVMSNLGFIKFMESQGIRTEKTAVGDRYVLENMRENGYAIGGGHVLHVVCDLTIASENAIFGQTGPHVGSFDAGFGSSYLARIIGQKKAREMWFLCRQYSAQEALQMGLVNKVVPLDKLEDEGVAWAERMMEMSPMALRMIKVGLNAELDGQAGIQELAGDATLLYYLTDEAQEGGKAFLEKRRPRFEDYPKFP